MHNRKLATPRPLEVLNWPCKFVWILNIGEISKKRRKKKNGEEREQKLKYFALLERVTRGSRETSIFLSLLLWRCCLILWSQSLQIVCGYICAVYSPIVFIH